MQASRMNADYLIATKENPRISAFENPLHPRSKKGNRTRMKRIQALRMNADYLIATKENPRISAIKNPLYPRSKQGNRTLPLNGDFTSAAMDAIGCH